MSLCYGSQVDAWAIGYAGATEGRRSAPRIKYLALTLAASYPVLIRKREDDGLKLGIRIEALWPELAPKPGVLETAERGIEVKDGRRVNGNNSGANLSSNLASMLNV